MSENKTTTTITTPGGETYETDVRLPAKGTTVTDAKTRKTYVVTLSYGHDNRNGKGILIRCDLVRDGVQSNYSGWRYLSNLRWDDPTN